MIGNAHNLIINYYVLKEVICRDLYKQLKLSTMCYYGKTMLHIYIYVSNCWYHERLLAALFYTVLIFNAAKEKNRSYTGK